MLRHSLRATTSLRGAWHFLRRAQLVVGELSGFDPVQRAAIQRGRKPVEQDDAARRALDPLFGKDIAATYIALSIDCESPKLIETVDIDGLTKQYEGSPLMEFRLSRCGRPAQAKHLATLRANDPRWTDVLFWEARGAIAGAPGGVIDLSKVIALYGEGRAAFPKSLALTMAWANANLSAEEFAQSQIGFDDVLSVFGEHRDALMGRVQALSYQMQHADAVATATRVIDLGTWHLGDAYYWRAWNRYHLKEYETAWADVENAIKGLANARVYMLAGLIAYERKELPTAVQRFDRAYEIDSSACDATWMSGLVSIDQQELATAAPKFTRAMSCFISSAAALRQNRDARRTTDCLARHAGHRSRDAGHGAVHARRRQRRREVRAGGVQRRAMLRAHGRQGHGAEPGGCRHRAPAHERKGGGPQSRDRETAAVGTSRTVRTVRTWL